MGEFHLGLISFSSNIMSSFPAKITHNQKRKSLRETLSEMTKTLDIREALKKNYRIIWEFFPNVGPPTPPFWEFQPFFTVFFWSGWKFLGDFKVF